MLLLKIKGFICDVHDQVNDFRGYFDIHSSFFQLLLTSDSYYLLLLPFFFLCTLYLSFCCYFSHLRVDLFVSDLFSHLLFKSCPSLVINNHFLALCSPKSGVSNIFLLSLLFKESLDELFFIFFGIKRLLDGLLIDMHLPKTSFPLLSSELIAVLGLLDLVHGGGIREVLDLARRNACFFLLLLYSLLDSYVLLNTKLLHVLLEPLEAFLLVFVMEFQLFLQAILVDVDFPIFKVELSCNFFSSSLSVCFPVAFALSHPLFHELLVFFQFLNILLSFALLDALKHIGLCEVILSCLFLQVGSGNLIFEQLLLDLLQGLMDVFECGTIHSILFVYLRQFYCQVSYFLDFLIHNRLF